jgi:hypothetical protein
VICLTVCLIGRFISDSLAGWHLELSACLVDGGIPELSRGCRTSLESLLIRPQEMILAHNTCMVNISDLSATTNSMP